MEEMNQPQENKSIKGYQIVVVIMIVILAALSFMYFKQVRELKAEYQIEKDTLTNRLTNLMFDYDNIRTTNDTISHSLEMQRGKADSLMTRLSKERSLNRSKIKQYENELGTLRTVMRGFVKQIDSLNTLNTKLIGENVEYRKQVTTERLRADKAEEKADELDVKVRKGAVIRARDIALLALNERDKDVTRASRAARLRIDFVLSGNELSKPGSRNVYVRLTGPDGYILANSANALFSYEGDRISYSATREIDYQNQDLPVSIYYNGSGITGGKYKVAVYMDGYLIGSNEIVMR